MKAVCFILTALTGEAGIGTDNDPFWDMTLDIAVDNENNIWIGTDEALLKYDHNDFTAFTPDNSPLLHGYIREIVIDECNNKWLATGIGVAVYNEDGINFCSSTGIEEVSMLNAVKLYPNPVMDVATFEFYTTTLESVQVSVLDMDGRVVYLGTFSNTNIGANTQTINLSQLENGIYIYTLKTKQYTATGKIYKR